MTWARPVLLGLGQSLIAMEGPIPPWRPVPHISIGTVIVPRGMHAIGDGYGQLWPQTTGFRAETL